VGLINASPYPGLKWINSGLVTLIQYVPDAYISYVYPTLYYTMTYSGVAFSLGFMTRLSGFIGSTIYAVSFVILGSDGFINHYYMKGYVPSVANPFRSF
jgi:hypothetical protein